MRAFTNRTARKFALLGATATAGLLLSACGTDDPMSGMDHGGTSATATATASASASGTAQAGAPGAFNDADVMFAQMMIPHHEQALEMAELADGRAEDPEVKRLVAAVKGAQDPEIAKMRAWLKGWGKPESAGHGSGSGHGMSGMMSEQDMKDLAAVKGKAFDRKFAELMIAHHEGAVAMAEDERKDGGNTAAKALADDVVRTQSEEIAALRKILDRL
ncbi:MULTISPECIES: DUF305 domain-containing protein [Streptomyces]|uniref:DUF305 domain-containing protein n=1 Tax=Streptomyces viridochromogenes TaxID=1938 RepID=A0A0L8LAL1_STRVR|nr:MULTISPECIES: DUF305 domain-containing protein [Streptomyces]KOG35134.1 hypothetical protein ADK34_05725 [Streptomyces viridochromogenes]